jgi:putative transposase
MSKFVANPIALLLVLFAARTQRGQQRLIDFLVAENRILRKKLAKKRVPLNDAERAILGRAGKAIGRMLLEKYATIATPDTILRWHRKLIALKWTFNGGDETDTSRPVGRPRTPDEIEQLVVKLAKENPGWGYDRIVGALANLDHEIGATTVGEILARNGIPPAPRRRSTWAQFIKAHHAVLAGADFFTTEVWTKLGLTTVYTLFAIRLATRRVEILGTTTSPNAEFMAQVARNIAIERSPLFDGVTHLIIDRDSKYSARFEELMREAGIELVKIPAKCPAANGVSERFVKSVKYECLRKLIFFGIGSLERALREYVEFHYRHERNHQGIGNRIIEPGAEVGATTGRIVRVNRLGGLLRYYRRVAA